VSVTKQIEQLCPGKGRKRWR